MKKMETISTKVDEVDHLITTGKDVPRDLIKEIIEDFRKVKQELYNTQSELEFAHNIDCRIEKFLELIANSIKGAGENLNLLEEYTEALTNIQKKNN